MGAQAKRGTGDQSGPRRHETGGRESGCLHFNAGIYVDRGTVRIECPECGTVAPLTDRNAGAVLSVIGGR